MYPINNQGINNTEVKSIPIKSTAQELFLIREKQKRRKTEESAPVLPTFNKAETRQILNNIRKRWKNQTEINPMFLSDTLQNNMTIQEFCLNYELLQCQKRVDVSNQHSSKKHKN